MPAVGCWTTPYHPQSDGLVERFNRPLLDMLSTALKDDEQDWDLFLLTLLFVYRTSHHVTTRVIPLELMLGHDAYLPEDVLFSIPATAEDPIQYADHRHMVVQQGHQESYDADIKGSPYCNNDLVFLRSPQGFFKVVKVLEPSIYRIVDFANPQKP